ncbi:MULTISPECIES: LexA family transcriptional regulator [Acetobacter]|uniref:Prophage Repressor n=1 Tax=Acetobacter pomorum DM001 TaxID=945681 RepID=F1YRX7_9PROT|nr:MULTISPECIES: S24 family peptidase [Acetobacter]AXC27584.1 helix-turn-helix transcriptional regulator [Acetobacter sp. JWB]EGE48458.1 Prophage Repressor [Acetobacter pomorum DM001]KAA8426553.1 helix-turn-helix transcriptional regulator [Acetobacter pomorum]KAA8436026.1 helix-turn-helix transcriptional regulator [Acetobacter pomorum]KAA8454052.1 helix-turn-helix transcriptional regulator [Acetobacter pomorum]
MAYELLLSRIADCLHRSELSETAACEAAGVGVNTIRHIRKRGHSPKIENLCKLAYFFGVPPAYFLEAAAVGGEASDGQMLQVQTVFVKGAVQAGRWKDAVEWAPTDWYPVYTPTNIRYPNVEKFGLLVRGDSMNKVYPDGSIVIAIKFSDIGSCPQIGQRVVVVRRSVDGFEATVKKFDKDGKGRIILWPESFSPEYQQPIILDGAHKEVYDGSSACAPDVSIEALVVGSYRSETL